MRVRIDIGLDFEGNHTFTWRPSDDPDAIDVPRSSLARWDDEREAFQVAYLRWKRVIEEIEEVLFRADEGRGDPAREPALAVVGAMDRVRHSTR